MGEVSSTGLHGANRIALNSLVEYSVYGRSAAHHIAQTVHAKVAHPDVEPGDASQVIDSDENVVIAHNWAEIRRFMWDYVGIVGKDKRL